MALIPVAQVPLYPMWGSAVPCPTEETGDALQVLTFGAATRMFACSHTASQLLFGVGSAEGKHVVSELIRSGELQVFLKQRTAGGGTIVRPRVPRGVYMADVDGLQQRGPTAS